MENIESLIEKALKLFPDIIDISDGELRSDNGFYSNNLSTAWREAENKNGVAGNDVAFMIWAVFGLLHRKSQENFSNGIFQVAVDQIDIDSLIKEYNKAKNEAE